MRDRQREALARPVDDAALEPVRAALRDASRRSARPAGTCAPRPRSPGSGRRRRSRRSRRCRARIDREALVEPLLRARARLVLVRDPVAERRVERGADDEHPRVARPRERSRISSSSSRAADGLVRDDEDAVLASGGLAAGACATGASGSSRRRRATRATTAVTTTKTATPTQTLISDADHDQREVADRQPDEPERICFAPERIPHALLEEVDGHVHDDPHHVDEVPVDAADLDAVVVLGREVARGTRGSSSRAGSSGRRRRARRAGRSGRRTSPRTTCRSC